MDESRRNVLKGFGYAAAGLGVGFPLLRALASSGQEHVPLEVPDSKQLGMVVDVRKCLNEGVARACMAACRIEHNIPGNATDPERVLKWIWTEPYQRAFTDQTHSRFATDLRDEPVLVLCNHCARPACTKVCPTGATWKRKADGVVMMDMHRCIGCRYCIVGCPYGARSFNWYDPRPDIEGDIRPEYPTRTKGVVEKCTFCAERIRVGREPACVEASRAVPGGEGALTFGDLSDPESDVARLLREKHTISRKLGLGTAPNVYYIV